MMNVDQFEALGSKLFGGTRWGSKMAERTGLSTALISQIRNGQVPISPKTEARVLALAGYVQTQAEVQPDTRGPGTEVSLAQTPLAGEAKFKLMLLAKDLLSNKFVKAVDVNPALFFPEFAPPPAPVYVPGAYALGAPLTVEDVDANVSDEEMLARIQSRIRVMDRVVNSIIYDGYPAMISYGPPGVGKSYTVMRAMAEAKAANPDFHYDVIKGAVRSPGLYKALWNAKDGGVVVLDDSDSVYDDEDCMNLLKAALDTTETRLISWRKESSWLKDISEDVEEVRNFVFNGGVIFITNKNLKQIAASGTMMAKHAEALISRSLYIDLTMDSTRAKILRVQSVFPSMAAKMGLDETQAREIMDFMLANKDRLSEISLRMAAIITRVYLTDDEWQETIRVTKMK